MSEDYRNELEINQSHVDTAVCWFKANWDKNWIGCAVLQRRFRFGYTQSSLVLTEMEKMGLLGPKDRCGFHTVLNPSNRRVERHPSEGGKE